MNGATKIRRLVAPTTPLKDFDPAAYLSSLEFYETDVPLTDTDRDDLAQFIHYLAFIALNAKSTGWKHARVMKGTSAYLALNSHFSNLDGWGELLTDPDGIPYSTLARFLLGYFPPRRRS